MKKKYSSSNYEIQNLIYNFLRITILIKIEQMIMLTQIDVNGIQMHHLNRNILTGSNILHKVN